MASLDYQKLKEAIYKYLVTDTNSFKTAIGASFYDDEPNEDDYTNGIPYPHCIYSLLPGELDRDSSAKYEKPVIRFTFFDDQGDSSRITNLAALLDARFDECESGLNALAMNPDDEHDLGVAGMTILDVRRITTLSNLMKTDLGNWQLPVDYRIEIQRT